MRRARTVRSPSGISSLSIRPRIINVSGCCRRRYRRPALRQNSIHLRFQQLRLSFSQPNISRSKFDASAEVTLIKASQLLTLDFCKCMKTKRDGIFTVDREMLLQPSMRNVTDFDRNHGLKARTDDDLKKLRNGVGGAFEFCRQFCCLLLLRMVFFTGQVTRIITP